MKFIALIAVVLVGYALYNQEKKKQTVYCKAHLKSIGIKFIESNNDLNILKNQKCPESGIKYNFDPEWIKKHGIALTCFQHKKDSKGFQVGHSLYTSGKVK